MGQFQEARSSTSRPGLGQCLARGLCSCIATFQRGTSPSYFFWETEAQGEGSWPRSLGKRSPWPEPRRPDSHPDRLCGRVQSTRTGTISVLGPVLCPIPRGAGGQGEAVKVARRSGKTPSEKASLAHPAPALPLWSGVAAGTPWVRRVM